MFSHKECRYYLFHILYRNSTSKGESLVEIKSSPEGERDERDAAMVNLTTSAVALHVLSVGCTVTRQ